MSTATAPLSPSPATLPPLETGARTERPRSRKPFVSRALSFLPAVTTLVLAISAWYAVSYLVLTPERRFLLPPPHRIVQVSLLDFGHLGPMLEALWLTAQVSMVGLLVACVLGIGSALVAAPVHGQQASTKVEPYQSQKHPAIGYHSSQQSPTSRRPATLSSLI